MTLVSKPSNHISILKWVLRILQFLGCCRQQFNIMSAFTAVSLMFMVFLLFWDMSINLNGIASLKRIRYLPACFMAMVKGLILIVRSKEVLKVLDQLNYFWTADGFSMEMQKRYTKIFKIITILSPFYICCCLTFCIFLSSLAWIDLSKREFVLGEYSFCNKYVGYDCWFSMWFWQSFYLLTQAVPISCLFDTIFMVCAAYVYNGCELLKTAFEQLNTDNGHKRYKALKYVVNQHNIIIKFVKEADRMFTGFMLVQFTCSLWSLVLYLYMMVVDGLPPKVADLILFGILYIIFCAQLLIYALGGTIIEEELKSLPTAMFQINWHSKGRTELRKELSLMIFKAQNTKYMSAGKMTILNLVLFASVVKNSLSIFTLILQFAKN